MTWKCAWASNLPVYTRAEPGDPYGRPDLAPRWRHAAVCLRAPYISEKSKKKSAFRGRTKAESLRLERRSRFTVTFAKMGSLLAIPRPPPRVRAGCAPACSSELLPLHRAPVHLYSLPQLQSISQPPGYTRRGTRAASSRARAARRDAPPRTRAARASASQPRPAPQAPPTRPLSDSSRAAEPAGSG